MPRPRILLCLLLLLSPVTWGEYYLETVQTTRDVDRVTLSGTVIPYKESSLAAQVPGQVEYVAGSEGDRFVAADLLVTIDDDELQAKRRSVIGQIQQAEAFLRNAQVQYQRELFNPTISNPNRTPGMGMPTMFDQMFTQKAAEAAGLNDPSLERYSELYASGSQISQAQAALLQARSALDEIDANLREARTHAPFDGIIMRKLVEVGDTVQPGQLLLHFAQVKYLRIQAEIPARLVSGLRKGMLVPARLDVGNTRVYARVYRIFPVADPIRHTVTVKFDLPVGVHGGPGMYAEVMIEDPNSPAEPLPMISMSAIVRQGSLPGVYVVNSERRTELRKVRLGNEVEEGKVIVLSGLRPGEQVIANPDATLRYGRPLELDSLRH